MASWTALLIDSGPLDDSIQGKDRILCLYDIENLIYIEVLHGPSWLIYYMVPLDDSIQGILKILNKKQRSVRNGATSGK